MSGKNRQKYSLAVVSDIHIGDPRSTIFSVKDEKDKVIGLPVDDGIYFHEKTNKLYRYPHDSLIMDRLHGKVFYKVCIDDSAESQYAALTSLVQDVDCLVILGDLFDVSVQRNDIVYELVSHFLQRLHGDVGEKDYIFVPGNHDYSLWRSLQWENDVIGNVVNGKAADEVKHVVPGVLSLADGEVNLKLYSYKDTIIEDELEEILTEQHCSDNSRYQLLPSCSPEYGGTHLDDLYKLPLSGIKLGSDPNSICPSIKIAYPNLYIISEQGEVTMLTHGHYFEKKWCEMSEAFVEKPGEVVGGLAKLFHLDLKNAAKYEPFGSSLRRLEQQGSRLNLARFVQENATVCSLQSGVGRDCGIPMELAGLLLNYSKQCKAAAGNGDTEGVHRLLHDIARIIEKMCPSTHEPHEQGEQSGGVDRLGVSYQYVSKILHGTAYNEQDFEWYSREEYERHKRYIQYSLGELRKILGSPDKSIKKIIFGHTHVLGIASMEHGHSGDNVTDRELKDKSCDVFNTGGWLKNEAKSCGALVPILVNGEVESVRIF